MAVTWSRFLSSRHRHRRAVVALRAEDARLRNQLRRHLRRRLALGTRKGSAIIGAEQQDQGHRGNSAGEAYERSVLGWTTQGTERSVPCVSQSRDTARWRAVTFMEHHAWVSADKR